MGVYEGFVHRQLRTTMDVSCPAYLDFVHGGLQMQIAHHVRISLCFLSTVKSQPLIDSDTSINSSSPVFLVPTSDLHQCASRPGQQSTTSSSRRRVSQPEMAKWSACWAKSLDSGALCKLLLTISSKVAFPSSK